MSSFFFFFLSFLLLGNIYYISEVLFVLAIITCLLDGSRVRYTFNIASFFVLFAFLFTKELIQICFLFTLFFTLSIKYNSNSKDFYLVSSILKVNLVYGFFLYLGTLIIGHPTFSNIFELGLYGIERSFDSKGISPYAINNVLLPRFYGFTSEPSIYSVYTFTTIYWLNSHNQLEKYISTRWLLLIFFSVLLSMSLTGFLLLILFIIKKYNVFRFNTFLATLILFLFVSYTNLGDALFLRYFGRFGDILSGTDGSYFIRFVSSFGSLLNFLEVFDKSTILFGLKSDEIASFLNSLVFLFDSGEILSKFQGTNGNAFVIIILNFGFFGFFYISILLLQKSSFNSLLLLIVFLLTNSFVLTLGFISALFILKSFNFESKGYCK